jgi:L,D-transpeptidase YcbB
MVWKSVRRTAVAIVVALPLACGGGSNDNAGEDASAPQAKAGTRDHIRTLLANAPDTGAVVIKLVTGDTLRVSPQTALFYSALRMRFRPAWIDGDRVSDQGEKVLAAIAAADMDGLDPARYDLPLIQKVRASAEDETVDVATRGKHLAELDVLLSEGYMRYAADLVTGAVPLKDSKETWRIPRREAPTVVVLRNALRRDPSEILQQLRPTTPYYGRLQAIYKRLHDVKQAGGWPTLPEMKIVEGDSADAVRLLRTRLAASEDAKEATLANNGAGRAMFYDRDLRDALRHFQLRMGQDDDGKVGSATLRELNHSIDDRLSEIRLNMDRWRWLPNELGQLFVMVNIAGFELEVIENNRPIESMNVVVGKTSWKTPVFADTMESIVVNPYWNPPPSIYEEEILPAMARDPSYLERNNFERVKDGVRQRPGPTNALGYFKFLFPNKDNIYLHDTPADNLFSRTRRDFSHGCIRLERPDDLAYLLAGKANRLTPAQIEAMRATGQEKWIQLKRPIPVYIVYFTTWVNADGTVRFHHDVYGHDEEMDQLEAAAKKVAVAN